MTDALEHGYYEELLPMYALGAVAQGEEDALRAHLRGCMECQAKLAGYSELSDALLYTVPARAAPSRLTEDLRKRIAAPTAAAPRSPGWLSFFRRPGFALGFAALALLLLTNIYWAGRTVRAEQQIGALREVTQTQGIALNPSDGESYASGVLFAEQSARVALLCVYNLPELDPGKTYQAWLVRGAERINGGTFRVDASGYGVLLVQSEEPLGAFEGFGITVEPAGGSVAPTTPRVMGGNL